MKKRIDSQSPLVLRLQEDKVPAERFLKLTQHFLGVLRNVSDEVSGKKDGVVWMVSAQTGSMIISASPEPRKVENVVVAHALKAIKSGFGQLETKDSRPEYFSDTSLYHLRELSALVTDSLGGSGVITIRHENKLQKISSRTFANVSGILEANWNESGSIEGRIALISDRGRFEVQVDDLLTGHAVKCLVSGDMEQKLIAAFKRRVVVSGNVHFRKDGVPIRIEVHSVRVLGGGKLPTFGDVRGILTK